MEDLSPALPRKRSPTKLAKSMTTLGGVDRLTSHEETLKGSKRRNPQVKIKTNQRRSPPRTGRNDENESVIKPTTTNGDDNSTQPTNPKKNIGANDESVTGHGDITKTTTMITECSRPIPEITLPPTTSPPTLLHADQIGVSSMKNVPGLSGSSARQRSEFVSLNGR